MGEIFLGSALTGVFFLTFLFLVIAGLKKRRMKSIYLSLGFLFFTLAAGIWTGYIFVSKAYNTIRNVKLDNPFKDRSGNEIYTALFGAPITNCVEVTNNVDQIVPRLDCCIWLEFKTCPSEMKRIIELEPYKKPSLIFGDSSTYLLPYSPAPEWFKPARLGDSMIILHNVADGPSREQVLLFSKDSTHAFYCDMAE